MGCEGGQGFLPVASRCSAEDVRLLLERNIIEVEHGVDRFAGSGMIAMTQH